MATVNISGSGMNQRIIRAAHHFDRGDFSGGKHMNREYFGDQRVFAVPVNDSRLATYDISPSSVSLRIEQDASGPTFLVVGPAANDDQLARASDRFGIRFSDLVALRARNAA